MALGVTIPSMAGRHRPARPDTIDDPEFSGVGIGRAIAALCRPAAVDALTYFRGLAPDGCIHLGSGADERHLPVLRSWARAGLLVSTRPDGHPGVHENFVFTRIGERIHALIGAEGAPPEPADILVTLSGDGEPWAYAALTAVASAAHG